MGLNCGASCAKYVLFAFNIIFVLGGAAVLGVGIWIRVDSGSFTDFLKQVDSSGEAVTITDNIIGKNLSYIYTVGYVLIGIGSFVFLVGFMGCCGACKEWRPLLIGYAICLIIIMCAEIGVGIAVGVYKNDVVKTVEEAIKNDMIRKYEFVPTETTGDKIQPIRQETRISDDNRISTNVLNSLHVAFQCCGLRNYTDLLNGSPYGAQHRDAPVFCCKIKNFSSLTVTDSLCLTTRNNDNSNQMMGCVTKIEKFIEDYAPAIIGVAVGIGLIELVGVFFSFCLCCAIGDERKYRN